MEDKINSLINQTKLLVISLVLWERIQRNRTSFICYIVCWI